MAIAQRAGERIARPVVAALAALGRTHPHILRDLTPAQVTPVEVGAAAAVPVPALVVAGLVGHLQVRLSCKAVPHVDADWVAANNTPEDERSSDQISKLEISDTLISEVETADTLLIGLPIYNFAAPASFKAWIDQICRARRTFAYSESGPVGLLKDKRAIVVYVSGGTPIGSDIDFASGYVRHIMGFIGITDVTFVAADQHMMDATAISRATAEITKLAEQLKSDAA